MSFYDTDDLIEKSAGRPISEIVEKDGWENFREIEKTVVRAASGLNNAVIATGGGVVSNEDNIMNLKKNGYVIWLEGDVEILMKRMEKDMNAGNHRPSLTGIDPRSETRKVLESRIPMYRRAADLVVNTDTLSPDDVAVMVMKAAGI